MIRTRPLFTGPQRADLSKLGLLPEQIEALENSALRVSVVVLRNEDESPARQDVLAELSTVAKALEAAQSALSKLEAARDEESTHAARAQARGRIDLASYAMTGKLGEEGVLHKLLDNIALAQAITKRAQDGLPTGPTRRQTATPYPIKLIHDALLHGWAVARQANPTLAPNFDVSAGLKSPFRRVVQLCYEVMQRSNDDPDRAIKGYMNWLRQERNTSREPDVPS
jgi:hypothetical protein